MVLDSTIETIASYLPEGLNHSGMISGTGAFFPAEIHFMNIARFLLLFAAGAVILSVLGRFTLGKRSSLNHSVSSVMAILFVYVLTIVLYTCKIVNPSSFPSPLPFVTFFNEYMVVMPIVGVYPTTLAQELLNLIILAFLVNLLNTIIPGGRSVFSWFSMRFATTGAAIALYLLIHWAFNTYSPDFWAAYAPLVLLILLVCLLLLGFFNAVLGLVLTITNPFLGAVYSFFFSNLIGKQLSKAVFTAGILCSIPFLMDQYNYSFVHVSLDSLTAYVPLGLLSLGLWYLTGYLL